MFFLRSLGFTVWPFSCVSFFLHLPLTRQDDVFSVCKYLGPGTRIPISRHAPIPTDVSEGGQGQAVWAAELSAFCIAHHGERAGGRNWGGHCLWLCCVTWWVSGNSMCQSSSFLKSWITQIPSADSVRLEDQAQLFSLCKFCHQSFCHLLQPV